MILPLQSRPRPNVEFDPKQVFALVAEAERHSRAAGREELLEEQAAELAARDREEPDFLPRIGGFITDGIDVRTFESVRSGGHAQPPLRERSARDELLAWLSRLPAESANQSAAVLDLLRRWRDELRASGLIREWREFHRIQAERAAAADNTASTSATRRSRRTSAKGGK